MSDKEKGNVENWLGNSINEKKLVLPKGFITNSYHVSNPSQHAQH